MSRIQTPFTQGQVGSGQLPQVQQGNLRQIDYSGIGAGLRQLGNQLARYEELAKNEKERIADESIEKAFRDRGLKLQEQMLREPPQTIEDLTDVRTRFEEDMLQLKDGFAQSNPDLADRINSHYMRTLFPELGGTILKAEERIIQDQTRRLDNDNVVAAINKVRGLSTAPSVDTVKSELDTLNGRIQTSTGAMGEAYVISTTNRGRRELLDAALRRHFETNSTDFKVMRQIANLHTDDTSRQQALNAIGQHQDGVNDRAYESLLSAENKNLLTAAQKSVAMESGAMTDSGGNPVPIAITTPQESANSIIGSVDRIEAGARSTGNTVPKRETTLQPVESLLRNRVNKVDDDGNVSDNEVTVLRNTIQTIDKLAAKGYGTTELETIKSDAEARITARETADAEGDEAKASWNRSNLEQRSDSVTSMSPTDRKAVGDMEIGRGNLASWVGINLNQDVPILDENTTQELARIGAGVTPELFELRDELSAEQLTQLASLLATATDSQTGLYVGDVYQFLAVSKQHPNLQADMDRLLISSPGGRAAGSVAIGAFRGTDESLYDRMLATVGEGTDDADTRAARMYFGAVFELPFQDSDNERVEVFSQDGSMASGSGKKITFASITNHKGYFDAVVALEAARIKTQPGNELADDNVVATQALNGAFARFASDHHLVNTVVEGDTAASAGPAFMGLNEIFIQPVSKRTIGSDDLADVVGHANNSVDKFFGFFGTKETPWSTEGDADIFARFGGIQTKKDGSGVVTDVFVPVTDYTTGNDVGFLQYSRVNGELVPISTATEDGFISLVEAEEKLGELKDSELPVELSEGPFGILKYDVDIHTSNRLSEYVAGKDLYMKAFEVAQSQFRNAPRYTIEQNVERELARVGWDLESIRKVRRQLAQTGQPVLEGTN